jgi:hypothetical protein
MTGSAVRPLSLAANLVTCGRTPSAGRWQARCHPHRGARPRPGRRTRTAQCAAAQLGVKPGSRPLSQCGFRLVYEGDEPRADRGAAAVRSLGAVQPRSA